MSFLSSLLGNYADDIAKAAAKTTAKNTAKTAGKMATKALTNKADDIARAATKVAKTQSDDVARLASKSLANKTDDVAKAVYKNAFVNQTDDIAKATTRGAKVVDFGADSVSKASKLTDMVDDTTQGIKGLKKASKSTATQKLASKAQNEYANSFGNITRNTRQELYGKYRGGGTIGDRLSKANVDVANVADKSSQALNSLGKVQRGLYDYADQAGVSLNLGDITKNSGLTKIQKSRINDILGIDLDGSLAKNMSTSEAEELYRTLRNQAATLVDSSDKTQALVGKNLQKVAKSISEKIDDTIEPLKKSYGLSQKTVQAMQEYGDDPNIIRNISKMGDKFSVADLRGEMQPWMIASEGLVGNKLAPADTLKIAGIDTGLPNVVKNTVQGVGELPLKAKAALENNQSLKNAALVGAGAVGGGLLGTLLNGGEQGASISPSITAGSATLGNITSGTGLGTQGMTGYGANTNTQSQPTINGYTYDQLEQGYFNAIQAGDSDAAKYIESLMGMLDEKVARLEKLKESGSSSDIATKQKAAINILNNLMQNYSAKGAISGNLTQFLNMLSGGSYDPQVYAYDTGSRGSLGSIIKALGDTGALSEGDQQRALQLLPSTTDSKAAAEKKYQQLLQILYSAGQQ